MCDLFTREDARSLLQGKYILLLGDSNMRALYKDLIWLLEKNTLIGSHQLRTKLEQTFLGDKLTAGDLLHKARNYRETRVYKKLNVCVKFSFLTKCYTQEVKEMLEAIKYGVARSPDVIVVNSCLWDISRWGPNGVPEYKDNMMKLMRLFKSCISKAASIIWLTTLPISTSCKGGFLIKQVEFLRHTLRFEVMEANMYARDVVASFGYDVLDVHYYMRMQIHRRTSDGIHWLPSAVRHISNLLLTHIAFVWNRTLPGNFKSVALHKVKMLTMKDKKHEVKLPEIPNALIREKQSELKLPGLGRLNGLATFNCNNIFVTYPSRTVSPIPQQTMNYNSSFTDFYLDSTSPNNFVIDNPLSNNDFPNLHQQFVAYNRTFGQNYTYANKPLDAVQKASKQRRKKRKCNKIY